MGKRGSERTFRCPPGHRHGETRTCYDGHGCGCEPCVTKNRQVVNEQRKLVAYGRTRPRLPAKRAADKLAALRVEGWTWGQIAEATGLNRATLHSILAGEVTTVMPDTERAVLAATTAPPKHGAGRVDATGTRRRLQALAVMGWTCATIAERLGRDLGNVARLYTSTLCTAGTAAQIADLYERLVAQPAPAHPKKAYIRRRAAERGWVGPLAWVDVDIDDPAAVPDTAEAEHDARSVVDELAHLRDLGESPHQACTALRRRAKSLAQLARDHQRTDLARWISQAEKERAA